MKAEGLSELIDASDNKDDGFETAKKNLPKSPHPHETQAKGNLETDRA